MQNFKRPYLFATSITDFWRRNHITLTKWLTDYIFTPLSIKYRNWGNVGLVTAVMITFLISGIWHGAAWTFVIYGLLHGTMLSFDAVNLRKRNKFEKKYGLKNRWWYIGFTGLLTYIFVCFSFVFFKSNSLKDAYIVLIHIFTFPGNLELGGSSARLGFSLATLFLVLLIDYRDEYYPTKFLIFENKFRIIRWSAYILVMLLILLLGNFESNKFIYFQF
jgi:D-alanyl-lipoteichoic acid acyltransferase DltB (MBOAT superfamily)